VWAWVPSQSRESANATGLSARPFVLDIITQAVRLFLVPTVLSLLGNRVVIYPNDHRPAHVHVIGGGNEAVFNLHCPSGPPELRENYGFSRNALRELKLS
jgi:Domain of unknown function (DUF4160)